MEFGKKIKWNFGKKLNGILEKMKRNLGKKLIEFGIFFYRIWGKTKWNLGEK